MDPDSLAKYAWIAFFVVLIVSLAILFFTHPVLTIFAGLLAFFAFFDILKKYLLMLLRYIRGSR